MLAILNNLNEIISSIGVALILIAMTWGVSIFAIKTNDRSSKESRLAKGEIEAIIAFVAFLLSLSIIALTAIKLIFG